MALVLFSLTSVTFPDVFILHINKCHKGHAKLHVFGILYRVQEKQVITVGKALPLLLALECYLQAPCIFWTPGSCS